MQLIVPVAILATSVNIAYSIAKRVVDHSIGVPAGFLPYCPGIEKNSTFTTATLKKVRVAIHRVTASGRVVQSSYPIEGALASILTDEHIDLVNKKTMLYSLAYLDTSFGPASQSIFSFYSAMGYNVLILDTFAVLSRQYPKTVRLTYAVGLLLGELLVKLVQAGLDVKNLELVGTSIGAHIASFAAKRLIAATGKKPIKFIGLDPAGPCYRNLPPDDILSARDADGVLVIHTNIDGFGMARKLGHVDFYVNGGEYQPDSKIRACLDVCSHVKVLSYYAEMLRHPELFVGLKCDSIQDARYALCYGSVERNFAGPLTDFNKPGIYYLPTTSEHPYYYGEDGLTPGKENFEKITRNDNAEELFIA